MPDQLTDLLHRTVDDVTVPHPDTGRIAARGRRLRTRRRVAAATAVAVAAAIVGVGGVVAGDVLGGDTRSSEVATPPESATPYDTWSAWSYDGVVTVGERPVEVPGQTVHLTQTSAGVVAKTFPDEGPARFTLVRPDGSTRRLSLPADVPTIDGDIAAPRIAWVSSGQDTLVLHVWDVAADEELARIDVPSPGTTPPSAGEILEPALLDGDTAYFQTGGGVARRVDWRTGEIETLPLLPFSVRSRVATANDGTNWVVLDAATGQVRRTIDGDLIRVTVSPDGRWLFLGSSEAMYVEPVAGGERRRLDEISITAAWSPGGAVVGQKGTTPTVLRCTTDGRCTERAVGEDDGSMTSILSADFLNAG